MQSSFFSEIAHFSQVFLYQANPAIQLLKNTEKLKITLFEFRLDQLQYILMVIRL